MNFRNVLLKGMPALLLLTLVVALLPTNTVQAVVDTTEPEPTCVTGHASSVYSYSVAARKDGKPVNGDRQNPSNALGAPQYTDVVNFVSLGFGGELILGFDGVILPNPDATDVVIVETSYGNPSYDRYPETAMVSVAMSPEGPWTMIGTAYLDTGLELPAGFTGARYMKFNDVSDPARFGGGADGYDVDGVTVCLGDEPIEPVEKLKLTSMCSDNPAEELRWRVRNPNDFDVPFTWEVYGTGMTGSGMALANSDVFFFTDTVSLDHPNTTKIYWNDETGAQKSQTKASGKEACAPVCTDPDPARDLKLHGMSMLVENDLGKIVNISEECSYDVGIASYEKFDNIIDHQRLFDYNDTVIEPGETLYIGVNLPQCAVQVDLYYGTHLPSLDGQRYGSRLIDARHLGGSKWCPNPPERECVVGTDIGAMSLSSSKSEGLIFVEASFAGQNPTNVDFVLGDVTHTEGRTPWVFGGDKGWDATGYSGEDTTLTVTSRRGYLSCETQEIDLATLFNEAPVAVAEDVNVAFFSQEAGGTTEVQLDGSASSDADGEIVSYAWSGAGSSSEAAPTFMLGAGIYQFTLTVTDDLGATDSTDVTVTVTETVNEAPVAVAEDVNVAFSSQGAGGTTEVKLDGSASYDPDGEIVSYAWSGAGSSSEAAPTFMLGVGTYQFTLTVTDDLGATDSTDVTVTVTLTETVNEAPEAVAEDVTVAFRSQEAGGTTEVKLDGSASYDPDGSIVSYAWSGAGSSSEATPTFMLGAGIYQFTLTVTDDLGATDSTDVTVTVTETVNEAPVAVVADQHVELSAQSRSGLVDVTLDGTGSYDPDGSIVSYTWSGAASATGSLATVAFGPGTHSLTLTVTDDEGKQGSASMTVTVNAAPSNQPPVAVAHSATLEANAGARSTTVGLDGSGSYDPDGSIVAWSWSGAVSASGANPSVDLGVGTHSITLTVTDDDGATASTTISVTVEAVNAAPVAEAGAPIRETILSGTVSVTVDGSGSYDPDGSIASYAWSGPNGISGSSASLTLELAPGSYTLTLTVTDNEGATATDTVSVTVNQIKPDDSNPGNPGDPGPGDPTH